MSKAAWHRIATKLFKARTVCIFLGMHSVSWWRHQMETFSALLARCAGNSPVTGEFPAQRSVARSCDVSLICALNKRLSKQSRGRWFETPSGPLWRQCNVTGCDNYTHFTYRRHGGHGNDHKKYRLHIGHVTKYRDKNAAPGTPEFDNGVVGYIW